MDNRSKSGELIKGVGVSFKKRKKPKAKKKSYIQKEYYDYK